MARETDRRKVEKAIRKAARANGLNFEIKTKGGKGSHINWHFELALEVCRDRTKGYHFRFTVTGGATFSPGLQRRILDRAKDLAKGNANAAIIVKVLERAFDD